MTTEPIIDAHGLTKRYPDRSPRSARARAAHAEDAASSTKGGAKADATVHAVTDLTFRVRRGELVAFLGPQSRANLWQHILELREKYGTTVFLTTHYLEEADRYAERVMVMDKGTVIADDTAARLKAELAGDLVAVSFEHERDAVHAAEVMRSLTDRELRRTGESVSVTTPDGDAMLPMAVRALDAVGIRVTRARSVPPTLDDVFLALTGRTLREAGAADSEAAADEPAGETPPDLGGAHQNEPTHRTTGAHR